MSEYRHLSMSVLIPLDLIDEKKVYKLVRPKTRRAHYRRYPREIPGGVGFSHILAEKLQQAHDHASAVLERRLWTLEG